MIARIGKNKQREDGGDASGHSRESLYGRPELGDAISELREYAAKPGWEIAQEYVDAGWSGAQTNRPELNSLMVDSRQRRFDIVLTWKLDRWGRSIRHSINSIQELVSLGIRFVAVTQNIDTHESNPMSRFMLHIMAAFAELEREVIRERVVSGVRAAKAKGKRLGRPQEIFRRDEAVRLRREGRSWRVAAKPMDNPA